VNLFPEAAGGTLVARVPPQDLHAEQATLGSMLLEAEAAERVFGMLDDGDFYREAHREIYRAMQACARRREPVDLITVSAEVRRVGLLDKIGGPEYLTALIGEVPTTAHVAKYAAIVHDKARLRRTIALGMETAAKAYDGPEDVQRFLEVFEGRARDLACGTSQVGLATAAIDAFGEESEEAIDRLIEGDVGEGNYARPKCGLPSLDGETGGLPLPGMTLDMGFAGSGKSTLAAMYAFEWAYIHRQATVIFTTGEETRRDTLLRFAAMAGGLDLSPWAVKQASRTPESKQQFRDTLQEFMADVTTQANLFIQPRLVSFDEFAAETRRLVRDHGVRFVILDYLERCLHKEPDQRDQTRTMERLSGRCQAMQAELGIALLVVSQVTESESGETKARYCAQLEDDAHLALRLNSTEKGTQEDRRASDKFQIILRKRKRGRSGCRFPVRRVPHRFVEETDKQAPPTRRDARDGLDGDG